MQLIFRASAEKSASQSRRQAGRRKASSEWPAHCANHAGSKGPQNDGTKYMCSKHRIYCVVTGAVCAQQRAEVLEGDIALTA